MKNKNNTRWSMTKLTGTLATFAVLSFAISGCNMNNSEDEDSVGEDLQEGINEMEQLTGSAFEASQEKLTQMYDQAADYTYDQRNEFSEAMNDLVRESETALNSLKRKADSMKDRLGNDFSSELSETKTAQRKLASAVDNARDATADTWTDAKVEVQMAWMNFKDEWNDAREAMKD